MSWLFRLRGEVKKPFGTVLFLTGVSLVLAVWFVLTSGETPILKSATLPNPIRVFTSYGDLLKDNNLIVNACKSIGVNLAGYIIAVFIALPVGFIIGLLPIFRGLFKKFIDAVRFVPLTATIQLFIVWFGIGVGMKSSFLAFGILIFFLPVVIERIDEVKRVYLQTVYTLGATNWQTVKSVYFPSVMSRVWSDLRIMTAISWTYVVFVEVINDQGGLGGLIVYGARRQGRMDKVFALLILIIAIGYVQDKIFAHLDKKLFPHKYQNTDEHKLKDAEESIWETISDYAWKAITFISLGLYILFALDEITGVLGNYNVISFLFGDTSWVIHFIFLSIIAYKIYDFIKAKTTK